MQTEKEEKEAKAGKGGYTHGIPKDQQKLKRIPKEIEPLVDELIDQYKKNHDLK